MKVKAVIVVYFHTDNGADGPEGEFKHWISRYNLKHRIPFPQGDHDLRMNDDNVIGFVAGIGASTATAATIGLGMDSRFDLSKAYWLIAGVAGGNPAVMTVGSVAWARYIVDADKKHMLDPREMPKDWKYGASPYGNTTEEFPQPMVVDSYRTVHKLNTGLAEWAYGLTQDIDLTQFRTPHDEELCSRFKRDVAARQRPRVILGDILAGDNFWHGRMLNDWACAWVDYWTQGRGIFAASAVEDSGVMTALSLLAKMGKIDYNRVMASRTASNFTCQWDGATAGESLATEDIIELTGLSTALESAYVAGSRVIDELVQNWNLYENELPSEIQKDA